MIIEQIIDEIIKLPINFHAIGSKSIHSLLKETGYFEEYNKIDETKILVELKKYPKSTEYWLEWSADKRNFGYYLKQNEKGKYVVGCISLNSKYTEIEFMNILDACAFFIKNEIEEIRKI